ETARSCSTPCQPFGSNVTTASPRDETCSRSLPISDSDICHHSCTVASQEGASSRPNSRKTVASPKPVTTPRQPAIRSSFDSSSSQAYLAQSPDTGREDKGRRAGRAFGEAP